MTTVETQDAKPPAKPLPPRRGFWPGKRSLWIVAVMAVGIAATRVTNWTGDHAATNIVTVLLGFWIAVTLGVWFFFFSLHSQQLRLMLGLGLLAVFGFFVATVRPENTGGDIVPRFRFVWQPPFSDQLVEVPRIEQAELVDMQPTPLDFPGYLGPLRDVSYGAVELSDSWADDPPRQVWRQPIGAGWSAFAAVNGNAVTMEQRGDSELVTCYSIQSGKLLWSHELRARHETYFGGLGPRSTPLIYQGKVLALGATGVLRCLNGANGQLLWQVDLLEQFGVPPDQDGLEIAWGRSNSPAAVDGLVIVPAGGPQDGPHRSLAAFDLESGELRWAAGEDQISYSSPIVARLAGQQQIVSVNEKTVSGHRIEDGSQLWSLPWSGDSSAAANTSQPIIIDANSLLVSKGYNKGCQRIEVSVDPSGQWSASVAWSAPKALRTKLTTALVYANYAYGLSDGVLQCVDLSDGQIVWKQQRLKHGQILRVGDRLLALAEFGDLLLFRLSPEKEPPLGRLPEAVTGTAWNNLCLYGRFLLVRTNVEAACYELPVQDEPPAGQ